MIEMDALARDRSEKTGEDFSQWLEVIEWAAETATISELTDGEFVALVENSSSVLDYQLIVEQFEFHRSKLGESSSGFDLLVTFVDGSNFSMSDWVKSIKVFHQWVVSNNFEADLERAFGYIQCCSQSVQSGEGELSLIVLDNLNTFGLEDTTGS